MVRISYCSVYHNALYSLPMKIVSQVLVFVLVLAPLPCSAQEVSFLIENTYASSPVPVQTVQPSGTTGGGTRTIKSVQSSSQSSSSAALLKEDVTSGPVDTQEEVAPPPNEVEEESSASSEESVSSVSPFVPTKTVVPQVNQEEQDELTLEQLEEYRDEAYANMEEQLTQLEEGFIITGTSAMGSPLTVSQRSAILRRNVRTVPQLKLFVRALAESDPNIREIEVRGNSIVFSYRQSAKLFGFIPLTYLLQTEIEEGVATVHRPWWHFATADGVATYEQKLQDRLQEEADDIDDIDVPRMLSAQQRLLQMITAVSHDLFASMAGESDT